MKSLSLTDKNSFLRQTGRRARNKTSVSEVLPSPPSVLSERLLGFLSLSLSVSSSSAVGDTTPESGLLRTGEPFAATWFLPVLTLPFLEDEVWREGENCVVISEPDLRSYFLTILSLIFSFWSSEESLPSSR